MTDTNAMTRYAVVGNPISHSKSPQIHKLFAQQTGETITYEPIESPLDKFQQTVEKFFAADGGGLNITVPFKEQAFALAKQHSKRAQLAGAVNTLWHKDGLLYGDNTDGVGLVRDLKRHHISLQGKHILLLGAGGAACGVLPDLLAEQPAAITIANRTMKKADAVVKKLKTIAKNNNVELQAQEYSQLPADKYELLINATSLSMHGKEPPVSPQVMATDCCCYDMWYDLSMEHTGKTTSADVMGEKRSTKFQNWAKQNGAKTTLNGLGMLVEQAAESFYLWRNVQLEAKVIEQVIGKL
ncbi:MAG: shikimate dehydrogenase [Pseudohongiellaceae bacterium]